MAEIVLINPRFELSFWGLEHALPFMGKRAALPVAALPLLAALTPEKHRITIIDENVEAIDFERCAKADIVGAGEAVAVDLPEAAGALAPPPARSGRVARLCDQVCNALSDASLGRRAAEAEPERAQHILKIVAAIAIALGPPRT